MIGIASQECDLQEFIESATKGGGLQKFMRSIRSEIQQFIPRTRREGGRYKWDFFSARQTGMDIYNYFMKEKLNFKKNDQNPSTKFSKI